MTNNDFCKWLLKTAPSADNRQQWESIANSVWLHYMSVPLNGILVKDISNIISIGKQYDIEIPNERTLTAVKVYKMMHDENLDFGELQIEINKL